MKRWAASRRVRIGLPVAILAVVAVFVAVIAIPAGDAVDRPDRGWGDLRPQDPLPCEVDGSCIEITQYPELCRPDPVAKGNRCAVILEGDEVNWNRKQKQKQEFIDEMRRDARGEGLPARETGCPAHRPSPDATPPPGCIPPTPVPTPEP